MIRVVLGALEDSDTEAILRPIRSDLTPVSAASRDVGSAAGPLMEERLQSQGSVPVGGAILTPGGSLAAAAGRCVRMPTMTAARQAFVLFASAYSSAIISCNAAGSPDRRRAGPRRAHRVGR